MFVRTSRVAEGNRRVVALRAAKQEFPDDQRFATMPAWVIAAETPESVVQDLLNEIHLGLFAAGPRTRRHSRCERSLITD